MPRKTIALATAAVAIALLAGCSGGGANGADSSSSTKTTPTKTAAAQSKAEACRTFSTDVAAATKGLQSQVSELQSDPQAAVAKLDQLNTSLAESASKITNSEVKPTTDALAEAFADFTAKTKTVADADDASALSDSGFTEALQKMQSTGQEFQELCGP